jgi:Fe-S cluster assembly protein SufD
MLLAEKQAKICILEDYLGLGGFGYMTNAVSELSISAGAEVIHVKLQRDDDSAFHIAHTHVGVDNGAVYRNWSVSVGGAVSRHNLVTRQREEGGHIEIKGLALGHDKRIVDTHSCIEHTKPHGQSIQVHKTIAGGRSKIVFNGKVKVHQDAQQTNSSQQNRNLLLSARASVDAKPELEIFADDVKCAHGATVGQVNDDELFYLKTRGLDDGVARNLLNYAFAKEVIDDLPIKSLAGVIESYIKQQTRV